MTPNIQFQPYRIFTRNDLFERIIKSCKATNVEFLMINEKLGLCLYGIICDEQEYILPEMQDDIKELKKENEESMKIKISEELTEESMKINISEQSTEESIEIKGPKKDENTTNWYDKNKFKKILAIVDSNKFNHKNKIGKFKYNDINELANSINKNTISEILAKKNSKCIKRNKKGRNEK